MPLFVPPDVIAANDAWGANCGPTALAAVLGCPVMALRDAFSWFPRIAHTNPAHVEQALRLLTLQGRTGGWSRVGGTTWPVEANAQHGQDWPRSPFRGLGMVQWTGPWTDDAEAGWAKRVAPMHTHVIGLAEGGLGPMIYDCNQSIEDIPGAWLSRETWVTRTAPELLRWHQKTADKRARGWTFKAFWKVAPPRHEAIVKTLELLKLGREIEATDHLVEHFDGLFLTARFQDARDLLAELDPCELPPRVLTGILTVTAHARAQVEAARADFFVRVVDALRKVWNLSPDAIARITERLGNR